MPRIISVISGKGGVGKTTLVSNMGVALAQEGLDVVLMDANITGPNLGLHFGLIYYEKSLHNVMNGEMPLEDAVYKHPSGVKIVPASLSSDYLDTEPGNIRHLIDEAFYDKDIVLIDSATGLDRETINAIDMSDEVVIITHPELPTMSDALRSRNLLERKGKKILGVVLNRIKRRDEIKSQNVSSFLDLPLIGLIHEDHKVRRSIEHKNPVVLRYPHSRADVEFRKTAYKLLGRDVDLNPSFFDRMLHLVRL